MPPYRLARLSDEQFTKIEALENELGLTLVAYEPAGETRSGEHQGHSADVFDPPEGVTDALLDAYRSHP